MNQLPLSPFMWQVGSKAPPKFCLCCGQPFGEGRERRGPYKGPYMWVCQSCWARPHLFFPDKPVTPAGTDADEYRQGQLTPANTVEPAPRASRSGSLGRARPGGVISSGPVVDTKPAYYVWQLGGREFR